MESKMKNNNLGKSYLIESNIMIHAPLSKVWQILSDFNDVYTWALAGIVKLKVLELLMKY